MLPTKPAGDARDLPLDGQRHRRKILSARQKKEVAMYAGIRQAKAKSGAAEKLASKIKEGAIPIISDVPGFKAYYVVYAPDDTVTAISIFDDYTSAQESNKRALAWIEAELAPFLAGPATAVAGPIIVHTIA
ncbi:antibiotic biosynthesis monooxygenase [Hyphomicrobium sp. 2TAF46]|uniref:antibiotic biosynthesis monooxygenase n=1 Tax=Hyphomicrobium sp. 2TAF46 TaxID=3233019 RepID=UPI003F92E5F0